MSILFVDACVRGGDSRTRRLAERLLARLGGEVRRLALDGAGIAPLDASGLAARERLLAAEDSAGAAMFAPARELAAADEVVIAAPYWDLSFPALLKAWAEAVNVTGITFRYSAQGIPEGLCRAKRLFYVATAGGPVPDHAWGFGYIEALAKAYWGIPDVRLFCADGLDIDGADPEAILAEALREIDRAAL